MSGPVIRVRLRVSPGSGRPAVIGRHGDAWKLRVAAPPERGRANDAVVSLLSKTLELPRPSIRLVSGLAARDKVVELAGIDPDEIDRRLTSAGEKESR